MKTSKYFYKERFALKLAGVSLNENENIIYKVYSALLIFCVHIMYPILALCNVSDYDFNVISDILVYEFGAVMGIFKMFVILKNKVKVSKTLFRLEGKPFLANFERGRDIENVLIKKCLWITSTQSNVYYISTASSIIASFVYTLTRRLTSSDYHDWQFSYAPFTLLNVTYSPKYEISWMYQNISIAYMTMSFTSIDLLTAGVLAHITFQYKILQNSFKYILENSRRTMMRDNDGSENYKDNTTDCSDDIVLPWKYLKNSLQEIVDYHLEIIELAKGIEDIFSTLLLIVFLGNLVVFCFMVYKASLLSIGDVQMTKALSELVAAILQITFVAYWGEQVLFESQKVGKAAFEVDFPGTDLRFQKGLLLIIRRSQNPTKVTAGKFADVCLATFTWVVRASYSAFMVLKNTNNA